MNSKDQLHWRAAQFMKESGLADNVMVKASKSGLTDHDMKDNGEMERQMAMGNSITLMATFMKEIGSMIRQTGTEHTPTRTVQNMLDSGRTISNMDLD